MSLTAHSVLLGVGIAALSASHIVHHTSRTVDAYFSGQSSEDREFALILKSKFQEIDIKPKSVADNHTHGVSAAARGTATSLAICIARACGKIPLFYQGSGANARAGLTYSRSYFWLKDLMAPASIVEPGPEHLTVLIDVDYYKEDMNEFLSDNPTPHLIYTFVPSKAANVEGEYAWRFLEDGKVEYTVSGGGGYTHWLWNWDGDSLMARSNTLDVFGLRIRCPFAVRGAGFGVERRMVDENHQLILLVPLIRTTNPFTTWLAKWKLGAQYLRRFSPMVGKFVRFLVKDKETLWRCTGRAGSYLAAKVRADIDDAIASTARSGAKVTLYTVKSKMDDGKESSSKNHEGAEILLEFNQNYMPNDEKVSMTDVVRSYQFLTPGTIPDPDAKPGLVGFMKPLLDGAFAPDMSPGNEKRFVEERVLKVQAKEIIPSDTQVKYMHEFAELLIPEPHRLMPYSDDVVYERQKRPSQRAILEQAQNGSPNRVTTQFLKKEAYSTVNDPRGISQINGVDKLAYSAFIYAFVDMILSKQPWYAFGKSPKEIAAIVNAICMDAVSHVDMTDFSRMDGRIGFIARILEEIVMKRAFAPEWFFRMNELMRRQYMLMAVIGFERYMTKFQRLSGSAETAAFNTLLTAFVNYATFRYMGYSPREAWEALGLYGGDDGITADLKYAIAIRTAKGVGQKLDLERVEKGGFGINFLARRYGPGVWFEGGLDSCCDIVRQLSKFHVTVNLPAHVTAAQKLQEKAFAFSLTDSNTPILGDFVKRVLAIYPLKKDEFTNALGIWGVATEDGTQYPNANVGDWMDDYVNSVLPEFDYVGFREWLAGTDAGTIFCPPRFTPALPPDSKPGKVAVDGDLIIVNPKKERGGTPARSVPKTNGKNGGKTRKQPPPEPEKKWVKKTETPLRNPLMGKTRLNYEQPRKNN